ncbi:alpha-N-arabinofuranosidase [Kineosporia succinea]|uniref:non-reducing end alpha-L-arabinofuranosidase n=1 Tax=Kineosporia succinea TaxID=84632 RepID=A0ABT9P8F5_9ACTN|nr:alpha-L-arabinofuranosidase C-terminal domain-containing protein [Kineosporia succinea]MDP9828985.1 alpha-N-arabinofuranosidase [Kineosporia succinea]
MSTAPARVVINLDLPGPTISRHLYGHFAEHLGRCVYGGFWVGEDSPLPHTNGIRTDVVEALKALRIPNLRWPGGCFADDYHWRDGIGPREQRPRTVNSHWGDVVEDNAFGTHEFMTLCELLGADPYVSGNVGSGTVREMSEWIEYLTRGDDSPMATLRRANGRDEPWKVPFWGLGNEAWGCGGNLRGDAFADLARQYATYVRDHGGNRVYRIAAGANADDYHWTESLMKALGQVEKSSNPVFQALSFHYYTMSGDWQDKGDATSFSDDEYYRTIAQAYRVEEMLTRHSTVMDRRDPHKRIGLVLDEWGTWWNVEEGTNPGFLYQQNTMRDALVASLHFDAFHRHADRLVMANIAQTVNVLQAMILTDPATGALVLTPTYHVFEMNTGHHDAASLEAHVIDDRRFEDVPLLSASASTTGESALISLSNLDAGQARPVVLDLRGQDVSGYGARILTSGSLHDHNDPSRPNTVRPRPHEGVSRHEKGLIVDLPAHSYVTVSLEL